ncbi:MAG: hypothetical protein G8345_15660 [Magnetococcales bacterium]|nr:hypothetical protein [Magnetococcales bacterium]NGZ28315.1 hypothetical protein [Magnetococcales bacterium]
MNVFEMVNLVIESRWAVKEQAVGIFTPTACFKSIMVGGAGIEPATPAV